MPLPCYRRYVAIGDSSTEGVDDPDGAGGYHGWANRFAEHVSRAQGGLLYANLAIRGRRTRQIRQEQLDRALAMRPDLVTLFSGTNDVVARRFDPERVADDIAHMHRAITETGATLVTFTLPDLTAVMPFARLIAGRLDTLNAMLREISAESGARLVDFTAHPVAGDPRLWSADRLHANTAGHARIAAALAQALELPGADAAWAEPLPPLPTPTTFERLGAEASWIRTYLLPWSWRHLRGRSTGDGITAKRPELRPVEVNDPG